MKISRDWLQTYFEKELPKVDVLSDALIFHAFEIESIEGDVLDVKVTPNRGHDCLSHRGIAKELSAILSLPMKKDSLRERVSLEPKTDVFSVKIEEPELCRRFSGAYIQGVRVGDSPPWLKAFLESVGQKSINSIVDITNYVMLGTGQPLHAFDARKLGQKNGDATLLIRLAKAGEKMLGLDEKEYELSSSMLVIADAHNNTVASIAGIKGGMATGIDDRTVDIIVEGANWDGALIRKTSQVLKLRTDASDRFQQAISPEYTAYGVREAADMIIDISGGTLIGFVDVYPHPEEPQTLTISTEDINRILGTTVSDDDIVKVFSRLGFSAAHEGSSHSFTVKVPFERLDLLPPAGGLEDLAEEVGRIIGYDSVHAVPLSAFPKEVKVNGNFYTAESVREDLMSKGFSEVYTSVFADSGERAVLNKVGGERPYLRDSLLPGLKDSLARNVLYKDLLGISEVKLFEIGTVWRRGEEVSMVGTVSENDLASESPLESFKQLSTTYQDLPVSPAKRYAPFSKFPFIVRDVAFWIPAGTEQEDLERVIKEHAGTSLVRIEQFDRFTKGEKTSLAYRLIFQSFDRTLTDEEANREMENVHTALRSRGLEIR